MTGELQPRGPKATANYKRIADRDSLTAVRCLREGPSGAGATTTLLADPQRVLQILEMTENRAVVDGIGGVFIYANNAKALADWYIAHLGIPLGTYEEGKNYGLEFKYTNIENPAVTDATVFSIQSSPTPLAASRNQVRVNYRVRDLTGLLRQLRAANIEIDKEEDYAEYGRFAWVRDPEGNKIELYQPAG